MAKPQDIMKLPSVKILDWMLFSSGEFKSIKNLFKYIQVEHLHEGEQHAPFPTPYRYHANNVFTSLLTGLLPSKTRPSIFPTRLKIPGGQESESLLLEPPGAVTVPGAGKVLREYLLNKWPSSSKNNLTPLVKKRIHTTGVGTTRPQVLGNRKREIVFSESPQ